MTLMVDQLHSLFAIDRLMQDGEFHMAQDLADIINRHIRRAYEYVQVLKIFGAPIRSSPRHGYRYDRSFRLEITESILRSVIAKQESLESRKKHSLLEAIKK